MSVDHCSIGFQALLPPALISPSIDSDSDSCTSQTRVHKGAKLEPLLLSTLDTDCRVLKLPTSTELRLPPATKRGSCGKGWDSVLTRRYSTSKTDPSCNMAGSAGQLNPNTPQLLQRILPFFLGLAKLLETALAPALPGRYITKH